MSRTPNTELADTGHSSMHGMLFMTLAAMLLTCMHMLVRFVSAELHPFEIAFFRNLFGLITVMPLILRQGVLSLRTALPGLQVLRGMLGVCAMLTWFSALSIVPLAEATALSFLAIIFASIGASLMLKERMRARRWAAVVIGFIGALCILRPGFREMNTGLLLVVASAMCWGMGVVIVKRLSRTDSTISIVGYMAISLTVLSAPAAWFVWTTPTLESLGWLFLIGILGTGGHLAITNALKYADTGAVMPLDFTRLIWASLFGFLVFAEVPDQFTLIGGGVIIVSASYIIFRESRLKAGSE